MAGRKPSACSADSSSCRRAWPKWAAACGANSTWTRHCGASPQLLLVDELAHANQRRRAPRHPKRWQDVDELLDAGIDVYTTMNVQHLESLNDVVAQITGVRVWETAGHRVRSGRRGRAGRHPARRAAAAAASEGKVYLPHQAERALENFFRKGNLIALRELALRRTADRVEGDVQAYRVDKSHRVGLEDRATRC